MSSDKEKRRFKRYKHQSEFWISIGEKSLKATSIDFSLGGLGIFLDENVSLPPGSKVDFKIEELNLDIDGKIVWSQFVDSQLRVGIERLSMSGSLDHYPLADILLDLQRSEKNGILEIKSGPLSKRVYIKNGDLIFATSNLEEDRLGDILLRNGKITEKQYDHSIIVMKETGKRHGTVLVEQKYLKANDLIWAVRHQVEEIILSLFQLEHGEFAFLDGPLSSQEVITLRLSAANLIYNGIKKVHNLLHINHAMPHQDSILSYSADPMDLFQDINLNDTDKEILSLVDGTRTMKEIFSLSPLDYFQTMRTLYALLSIRIVEIKKKTLTEDEPWKEIIEEPEVETDSVFIKKVEDTFDKLTGTDFYRILDIEKNATQEQIKKAYYKAAKVFHPDRHFSLPSETLKNKLHTIFSQITDAYRTLSDQKQRSTYDQSITIKPAKLEKSNDEIADIRFREGKEALRNGSFTDAAELFGQAAYLNSSIPAYYFYMGLAYNRAKKFREAEKAFRQALKLDPFNADYLAELGHVYLKLDLMLRAKTSFEKALTVNPSHEKAIEGLQQAQNHS
jgi:curved DNA-binding protein CbpA